MVQARKQLLNVPLDGTTASINQVVQRLETGGQRPAQRREDFLYLQRTIGNRAVVQMLDKIRYQGPMGHINSFHNTKAVQLVRVNPVITAGNKATEVRLDLAAGDHVDPGSVPSVDIAGWTALSDLRLREPGNPNARKWVRFHALNEHAGGPGDNAGNLTAATATANHHADWAAFEDQVKLAIPDNGGFAAQSVNFRATVGYPAAATTHWTRSHNNNYISTDAADYPNDIAGALTVAGVAQADAHLNGAGDGLYGPEHFKKIPFWKQKTIAGAVYGDGNDMYPGADNWEV